FALALLGTFLTRSGIVDSVHSFAPGPVGPALLLLLGAFLVVSVVLLASSARTFDAAAPERRVLARGSALIANNLVLALLTFAVLLGTLFPIVARVWEGSRVTVGESYYDGFAVPLGVALLFLMGVGPALPWGGAVRSGQALRSLVPKLLAGTATAGIGVALGARSFGLIAALSAGGFALAVAISGALGPLVAALREPNRARVIARLVHGRRLLGAHLAHAGIAIALVAIAASNAGKQTREATLRPGEWVAIGDYQVTFRGVAREHEPHRESLVARFDLLHEGRFLGHLAPRLSRYPSGENLGSPAVLSSPREDLYLTLLGLEPGRREIGLPLHISGVVSWLWIGIATSLLGALIALPFPSRKRARARTPAKAKAKAAVPLASHAEARA
ncbi:MAG: hypothetical protein HY901_32550, partial [Deltaproteobacteria bacterium]|nr:hypothetical protein [Deltaproteobacteria bacterium]